MLHDTLHSAFIYGKAQTQMLAFLSWSNGMADHLDEFSGSISSLASDNSDQGRHTEQQMRLQEVLIQFRE